VLWRGRWEEQHKHVAGRNHKATPDQGARELCDKIKAGAEWWGGLRSCEDALGQARRTSPWYQHRGVSKSWLSGCTRWKDGFPFPSGVYSGIYPPRLGNGWACDPVYQCLHAHRPLVFIFGCLLCFFVFGLVTLACKGSRFREVPRLLQSFHHVYFALYTIFNRCCRKDSTVAVHYQLLNIQYR